MSSLMMPRAGAGAVTVEGLTPEVLLAGHTVTVRRGTTVLEQVVGTAKQCVASFSGRLHSSDFCAVDSCGMDFVLEKTGGVSVTVQALYGGTFQWDGSASVSLSVNGTPMAKNTPIQIPQNANLTFSMSGGIGTTGIAHVLSLGERNNPTNQGG